MSDDRYFLTNEEVAQFRRDGFFIPQFRFSAEDVAVLGEGIRKIVELYPERRNQPIVTGHLSHRDDEGREFSLLPFCRRSEILDMIESIDGPDLMLWTTTVFHRPGGDGVATPWHQDGEFWPIEPLAGTSAWVAATPTSRQNGCVRVIPGSHRRKSRHVSSDDQVFGLTVDASEFDESNAVDIVLEAGQMMLFDSGLIHGSWPNLSDAPRAGFVMRYIPTSSYFNHDGNAQPGSAAPYADRALFLVRGVDRCGRNDFKRNHS
jgi:hypothetical protein